MPIVAHGEGSGRGDGRAQRVGHPGLVSLSTSQTEDDYCPHRPARPEVIRVEFTPQEARLRRMRDGVTLGCRLAEAELSPAGFRPGQAWMLTLTYAEPQAWEPRHVSMTIDRLRKWAGRLGYACAGCWCAEMQDRRYRVRGELAIHYHIIVWLPRGVTPPKPDKAGWWSWGMTRVERVRLCAAAYISKYASKGTEAPLPKGARTYASFGLGAHRARYSYLRRPAWLRELTAIAERVARVPGGGWASVLTGEFFESPWRFAFDHGTVVLIRKGSMPWESASAQS